VTRSSTLLEPVPRRSKGDKIEGKSVRKGTEGNRASLHGSAKRRRGNRRPKTGQSARLIRKTGGDTCRGGHRQEKLNQHGVSPREGQSQEGTLPGAQSPKCPGTWRPITGTEWLKRRKKKNRREKRTRESLSFLQRKAGGK